MGADRCNTGMFELEPGAACIQLTIEPDKITLEDFDTGMTSTAEWALIPITVNNFTGFYLETNEDVWNNRIGMQIFSENIMYGNGRVDDGNIYVYEKLD